MHEYEEKPVSQEEQPAQEEHLEEFREQKEHYVPRPKWQIAFAWVLVAVMVAAVLSYYYWIVYPYG